MCFMMHELLKYEEKKYFEGEDEKTKQPNPNNVYRILCRDWGRGGFKFVRVT